MSNQHEFSVQVLIHFRCGRCHKGWILPDLDNTTERPWACPRCEFIAEAIPMAPMEPAPA